MKKKLKNKKMEKEKKEYRKKIEKLIWEVIKKYDNRRNIYEPLSKLLPNYWNDTLLRSIKNVMFVKCLTPYTPRPVWELDVDDKGVKQLAKEVMEEEISLRKLIWKKNNWGYPYKSEHTKFFFINGLGCDNHDDFFDMYWNKLEYFVKNEEKRIELMQAIFDAIENRFQDGLRVGARSYKEKYGLEPEKLIDIYNNLEIQTTELKKIIDKQA
jgi:hypothetical protein